MKKFLLLFFSASLLFGSTELHEVLKLPFLLAHFREHRSETPLLTIMEFLRIHYTSGQHPDDNDDKSDKQLPFKSEGTIQHLDAAVIFKKVSVTPLESKKIEHIPDLRTSPVCKLSSDIFHPPQFEQLVYKERHREITL